MKYFLYVKNNEHDRCAYIGGTLDIVPLDIIST